MGNTLGENTESVRHIHIPAVVVKADGELISANDRFNETFHTGDKIIEPVAGLPGFHHGPEFFEGIHTELIEHGQWRGKVVVLKEDGIEYYFDANIKYLKND